MDWNPQGRRNRGRPKRSNRKISHEQFAEKMEI